MTQRILSAVAAREAVHLLILQELAKVKKGAAVVLKGGVNLRLFFNSIRYSEDMDLDGVPECADAIRSCITGVFDDHGFTRKLRGIGIRELDRGEGPNKDTETTFRYKFGVVMKGGIHHPTKVEVSFRDPYAGDKSVVSVPATRLVADYGIDAVPVRSYRRDAAVRQKIDALGGRMEAQARDVFDLSFLVSGGTDEALLTFLARGLSPGRLKEALERAYTITVEEYEGKVLEFLDDKARVRFGTEDAWAEVQLKAAELIETVLKRQGKHEAGSEGNLE